MGPMRGLPVTMALLLAACGLLLPGPTIDCRLGEGCDQVIDAARARLPTGNAHWLIVYGRGRLFHAEVHACYPDGRYLLLDVFSGDGTRISLRDQPREDAPCR